MAVEGSDGLLTPLSPFISISRPSRISGPIINRLRAPSPDPRGLSTRLDLTDQGPAVIPSSGAFLRMAEGLVAGEMAQMTQDDLFSNLWLMPGMPTNLTEASEFLLLLCFPFLIEIC